MRLDIEYVTFMCFSIWGLCCPVRGAETGVEAPLRDAAGGCGGGPGVAVLPPSAVRRGSAWVFRAAADGFSVRLPVLLHRIDACVRVKMIVFCCSFVARGSRLHAFVGRLQALRRRLSNSWSNAAACGVRRLWRGGLLSTWYARATGLMAFMLIAAAAGQSVWSLVVVEVLRRTQRPGGGLVACLGAARKLVPTPAVTGRLTWVVGRCW